MDGGLVEYSYDTLDRVDGFDDPWGGALSYVYATATHTTYPLGTVNPSTYAVMDRWFHYDQVGIVIAGTDASGALDTSHDQDAFGNTLASITTGLWGGTQAGWHHNTKEFDPDTEMYYMHQRWLNPQLGLFNTVSTYYGFQEHKYSFAFSNPIHYVDIVGRFPLLPDKCRDFLDCATECLDEFNKAYSWDQHLGDVVDRMEGDYHANCQPGYTSPCCEWLYNETRGWEQHKREYGMHIKELLATCLVNCVMPTPKPKPAPPNPIPFNPLPPGCNHDGTGLPLVPIHPMI